MLSYLPRAARIAAVLSLFLLVPVAVASSGAVSVAPGTIAGAQFHSTTMGEDISYNVYLPAGYSSTAERYPVIYLLHGRGDSMSAWTQVKGKLDEMIADGTIPPTIAIMPDAPWSSRRATTSTPRTAAPTRAGPSKPLSRPT